MIAQQSSAAVEMALLEPKKAQQSNQVAPKNELSPEKTDEFQLLGKDGLTFWDFLDIVNPLQHIPVISTLYRSITGDEINPAAKIAGGTLYGGPIGAISSLIDVAVEFGTGQDIGEHAVAFIQEEPSNTRIAEKASNFTGNPASGFSQNPYLARAGIVEQPVSVSSFAPPSPVLAQELGRVHGQNQGQHQGMIGIPIVKESYADQIAAYRPQQKTDAAPDLGMLKDIKRLEQAGIIEKQPAPPKLKPSKPLDLTPRYSANTSKASPEINARVKKAEAAYQKISSANNRWLIDSVMSGMSGLEIIASKPSAPKTEISAGLH